jgi:hypothetical protein
MTNSDLSGLLTAIWERLATLADHVSEGHAETSARLSRIEMQLLDGHHRMTEIERRQKAKRGTRTTCLGFLKQVASLKEWLAGLTLVVLALQGVLAPAEIKATVLTVLGIGPR